MRLDNQARNFALAVQYYSETYGKEPSETLRKPYSKIIAAYHLAAFSQGETSQRQAPVERTAYSQQGTQRNSRGDPERVTEYASVPLKHLAEDGKLQTKLQSMINQHTG